MRVAVVYNSVPDDASADERDVLVQVEAVTAALHRLGHRPQPVSCTLDLESLRRDLRELGPDVVFNLVEALGGSDRLIFVIPALLDVLRLPYTGTQTAPLFTSAHKLLSKEKLASNGLPTPAWITRQQAAAGNALCGVPPDSQSAERHRGRSLRKGRWIIKTVTEHASFGLDDGAVVAAESLAALERLLHERSAVLGRDCFAEEYIEGREFNLSLLAGTEGPQVLSPAEIDFRAYPPGKPRIVGHQAKWEPESFEYANTLRRFDFPESDRALLDRLAELAQSCWNLFGLHGYARVDFRVDEQGNPWILEVNANPCLSPDAGFAAALERVGIPFAGAVERILAAANDKCRMTNVE